MSRYLLTLVAGLIAWLPTQARATLEVVATMPDLAAIAKEIGGEHVRVTALALPNQDPHYVDPRPSLILPINRADLLLLNGLELEVGWLPPLLVAARNGRVQVGAPGYFDASSLVERMGVVANVDRAMGDVHPGGNPHFLYDPRAARKVVAGLATRMAELDPKRADVYRANAKAFDQKLADVIDEQRKRFAALSPAQRRVVTYHESMTYLFDWLDLEKVISVEPRPGIPPTPAHTARVLQAMKSGKISVLVQENFYPRKTSNTLARLVGGQLVVISGGTRFEEGQSYLEHIRKVADTLFEACNA